MARILVFKIRPSQEILKIRDGTPLEAEGILTYRKMTSKLLEPSQEILKIRDGTPLEAEGILTYIKRTSKLLGHLKKILKIRDGTPLEAEGIMTYQKIPRNCSVWHFSSKLDVPSNVVQKKRVARILVFKIRPSQEILKIRDGTPLEAEGILTYIKRTSKLLSLALFYGGMNFDIHKKDLETARTPLEAEGILIYRKRTSKLFSHLKKILKIRDGTPLEWPSQEILKIRDGTPLEAEGILTYRKMTSKLLGHLKKILKIRDGTPLEAEGIMTYQKIPRNCSVWHFSSKLDVPSNVVQKKRVARILVFKIRTSQEILKIRDDTPLEAEGILTYIKRTSKLLGLALFYKPSQEILKIRDGHLKKILKIRDGPFGGERNYDISKKALETNHTPLEAEGILIYRKRTSKLPFQEILKIRDGTPLEAEGILTYIKRTSKLLGLAISRNSKNSGWYPFGGGRNFDIHKKDLETARFEWHGFWFSKLGHLKKILKIRDGTPLEAEGIMTYQKIPRKCSVWHFSSKLDVPSNVVQKKRVARILVFKIRPSQEILKIRDGTPLEAEGILTYIKRTSKLLSLALF
ncbi:hypothetical protein OROGR_015501 [Orobanche gracilis]